jgi:hypothetical protein
MKGAARPNQHSCGAAAPPQGRGFLRTRKVDVSIALRMIITERFDATDKSAELDEAMRWHRGEG